jgi:L-rhamnose-H+ transport protein
MKTQNLEALGIIVIAAIMNATYTLPMKTHRKWAWEHSWLAFTILGVVLVPTLLAVLTVPGLFSIYTQIPAGTLAAMALFGAGWGVSLVFFGLALSLVGVTVTFAVCLGTSAAFGALIPLVMQHPEKLLAQEGILILAGLTSILVGVALCGVAVNLRDRPTAVKAERPAQPVKGFIYALLAGGLGSLFNLGLAFGGEIQRSAEQQGASPNMSSSAVWLPCLYAGFLPGVIYCLHLMKRNQNAPRLLGDARWHYWLTAICMGILWYGSLVLYAISANGLGELGKAIGWPLFLSAIVVTSTIAGVLMGEWTKSGSRPLRYMIGGVLCLVLAILLLSQASR